jgi:hypothetical protein
MLSPVDTANVSGTCFEAMRVSCTWLSASTIAAIVWVLKVSWGRQAPPTGKVEQLGSSAKRSIHSTRAGDSLSVRWMSLSWLNAASTRRLFLLLPGTVTGLAGCGIHGSPGPTSSGA